MIRPVVVGLSCFVLATSALAVEPESVGLFDFETRRFTLFDDLADGTPDATFHVAGSDRKLRLPIAGDWDGDGVTDLGFYDPRRQVFALFSDRADAVPDVMIPVRTWRPWLKPVVGDWNGDGQDDLALYDRYARRISLLSPERDGRIFRAIQLSDRRPGTLRPFAGDWDGDGVDEIGLYDAHERTVHLLKSKATGGRGVLLRSNERAPHLKPVALDWNGDGRDELALYDRASHRFALLADLADGTTDLVFDATAVTGEHLSPIAGRFRAAPPAGGGDVPDTAHCRPAADVLPAVAAFETELLAEINARRAVGAVCGQEGSFPAVPPLAMEPSLRCAARLHAADLAARGIVSSVGADGSFPEDRIPLAGYDASFVGELVAGNLPDPATVVDGWMTNGIQCSLVLEPGFAHAGAALGQAAAGTGLVWVLDLGAPR